MSEEQAVYNAKWLAEKCEKIAERIVDLAQYLDVERIMAESSLGVSETHALVRLGALIGWINEEVKKIEQEIFQLTQRREYRGLWAGDPLAEAGVKVSGYPNDDAIITPDRSACSAAYLVELGRRIARKEKEFREAAVILRSVARKLRGEEGGSEQ